MREQVSLKLSIQDAMDSMGENTSNNLPVYMRWAIDAEKRIGSINGMRKYIAVLNIQDCCAVVPAFVTKVEAVLLGDYGCDCGAMFDSYFGNISTNPDVVLANLMTGLLVIDNRPSFNYKNPVRWKTQDNKIVFSNNYDGKKCTCLLYGYEMDEEGFPLVSSNHTTAIEHFIMWKALLKSRWEGKRIQLDPEFYKDEWNRLCSDARAMDDDESGDSKEQAAQMYNDATSGRGTYYPLYNYYIY